MRVKAQCDPAGQVRNNSPRATATGLETNNLASLVKAPNRAWSVGLSAATETNPLLIEGCSDCAACHLSYLVLGTVFLRSE